MAELEFRPVTEASWPDFEALFESPGGPSYCWCMAWRADADERKAAPKGTQRKPLMKSRIDRRITVGLVGYFEGEPIAWVSIPRATPTGISAGPRPRTARKSGRSPACTCSASIAARASAPN